MKTPLERFGEKYIPEPNTGCWIWTGAIDRNGYGHFWYKGKIYTASHVSLMLFGKEPPPIVDDYHGPCSLHKCDFPPCVNPQHLFWGTHKENYVDQIQKGRSNHGEKNGQSKLTEEQIREIRESSGYRNGAELARRFGVARSTICEIKKGDKWKAS